MKSIELLSTGIRLLGIYVFIYGIKTGVYEYKAALELSSNTQDDMSVYAYVIFIQLSLLLIVSLLMFKFPVSLAKWILPKTKEGEVILDGSAKDIEISIFAVIGVYILSWAIPDIFHNGLWWWYSTHSEISRMWEQGGPNEYMINQVVNVLDISIGLYLCLRAQGLSNMFRKLREAGAR